jgi:hypothetical protein
MVRLIEKATNMRRDQIAAKNGYAMTNHFSDTSDKDVTFLRDAGIVTGKGGRYNPDDTYTRAEMAVMIGRAARNIFGIDTKGTHSFPDVPKWATGDVGYMVDNKITTGSDGKFNPDKRLTNQDLIVFAWRAFCVW